jgi:hypothetical protein
MNTDIQDLHGLQRAVVAAILAHPVREGKYGRSKEDQDRRFSALTPLWQAFIKGATTPAERLRRQRQLSKVNHHAWYLGPGAEEVAEVYFALAVELQDERLNAEEAQTQASLQAQAEGAAYVEESRKADALARLPAKERQAIASEKRLAYSLKKGAVPMERGAAHLFWSAGNDHVKVNYIHGRIDYRVLQTLAVCARCLIEERGDRPLAGPTEPVFRSAEELEKTGTDIQRLDETERPKFAPSVAFTDSDFRRILGKPKLSGAKIYKIVKYMATIVLDFTEFPGLSIQDENGDERWIKYRSLTGGFATILSDTKIDCRRPRAHKGQETLYQVYFTSPFGLAFLENMSRNAFILMPQRLFSLSARAQELFIAMSWRRWNEFKLSSLTALFGWTRMEEDARHYRRAVRRVLDELKRAGFVHDWAERENRDGETVYRVTVARKYLTAKKSSN